MTEESGGKKKKKRERRAQNKSSPERRRLLTGATRLREGAFLAAAEALAARATAGDASKGLLFPPFSCAADVSAAVAAAVAEEIVASSAGDGSAPEALEYFEMGAAKVAGVAGWEAAVRSRMVNLKNSKL